MVEIRRFTLENGGFTMIDKAEVVHLNTPPPEIGGRDRIPVSFIG